MVADGRGGTLLGYRHPGSATFENKRDLIRAKIGELAADPLSQATNVKRLQGRPEYRLRVQDWRVIFRIEDDILWIDDIAPRGAVYR